MKVLVTGSNGLIGNAIIRRIGETNLDLVTHTRRKESAIQKTQGVFFCGRYILEVIQVVTLINPRNGGFYARDLLIYTWKKNQE